MGKEVINAFGNTKKVIKMDKKKFKRIL